MSCASVGPVPGQLLDELPRPRLGDGADVVDDLLARHADAVVADGDGPRVRVRLDVDREVGLVAEKRGVRQRLEAQLVARVGRVRDELAQEDLLVRVQGVDHQIEQLTGLGLKGMRGTRRRLRHAAALLGCSVFRPAAAGGRGWRVAPSDPPSGTLPVPPPFQYYQPSMANHKSALKGPSPQPRAPRSQPAVPQPHAPGRFARCGPRWTPPRTRTPAERPTSSARSTARPFP